MTIYVVTVGDARHGSGVYGATTDKAAAEQLAEEAERHWHNCHGGPLCDRKLIWPNKGQRSREVFIREHEDFPGSGPRPGGDEGG